MKYPAHHGTTFLASGLVVLIATTTASVLAEYPGYAEDRMDSIVRTGAGECLHSSRLRSELEIPECGGLKVAVAPTPEPVSQQAAFEAPHPMETVTLDAKTLFEFDKTT